MCAAAPPACGCLPPAFRSHFQVDRSSPICIAIAISLFARLREEFKDPAIPRRHRMLGFIRARYADGRDKLRWQSQVATAPFRQQE